MPLSARRGRRISPVLTLLVSLLIGGLLPLGGAATARSAAAPRSAALHTDRLHFGLASGPSDLGWMQASGAPWRYRYQYLAGGVNTSGNWTTWQDPAKPPGQFAADYISASRGAGYTAVFTWYQLLQSTPSGGASESDRDFSNLNNAATMQAYYASFALLMRRAGAAGGPVIVHVEPDLWGYLQQRAAGGAAASLGASVASSGDPDVAGYANTVAGYAAALLHIRDLYAPNTLMAIHASMWSSGQDVASSTSASLDVAAAAAQTSAFLNSTAAGWDLVFDDVDDHDAGWWESQGADNQAFTHWWDPSNARFPNFTRYLAWVAGLHGNTGLPQVVWQVPLGNQRFLTMNNSCGHYQDNVAEYFTSHAADLRASGLIAVLFGAGNACQTTYTDAQHDGVTNNGGRPTSDAAGWCSACNSATSWLSDDDGGFVRAAVAAAEAAPSRHLRPLPAVRSSIAPGIRTVAPGAAGRRHPGRLLGQSIDTDRGHGRRPADAVDAGGFVLTAAAGPRLVTSL